MADKKEVVLCRHCRGDGFWWNMKDGSSPDPQMCMPCKGTGMKPKKAPKGKLKGGYLATIDGTLLLQFRQPAIVERAIMTSNQRERSREPWQDVQSTDVQRS